MQKVHARSAQKQTSRGACHFSKNVARWQCCKACIAARASELLRQKENKCTCFDGGRGLEIARSFRRRKLDHIMPAIARSRVHTWRDTRDMPGYMRQIGWEDSMRYSWLFPIAFIWRHFSNEEVWTASKGKKLCCKTSDRTLPAWKHNARLFCSGRLISRRLVLQW